MPAFDILSISSIFLNRGDLVQGAILLRKNVEVQFLQNLKTMKRQIFLATTLVLIFMFGAYAQTRVNVRFARGTSSATMRGTVTGYKYVDYRVGARGGQTMTVHLRSPSEWAQFVIFDPAMENVDGSFGDRDWTGQLPSDGTYTVRVMLPRAEARRKGSIADYSIRISIH